MGIHIEFTDTDKLTIPRLLEACNCSHLINIFPSLLIDQIHLRKCSMRIDFSDDNISLWTKYAHGRTGGNNSDHFFFDTNTRYDSNQITRLPIN